MLTFARCESMSINDQFTFDFSIADYGSVLQAKSDMVDKLFSSRLGNVLHKKYKAFLRDTRRDIYTTLEEVIPYPVALIVVDFVRLEYPSAFEFKYGWYYTKT
jgi:hypothetical protein